MDRKQLAGALCLLLVTAAATAAARPDTRLQGELVMTQPLPQTREVLRTYFDRNYKEAACSAVYVDLNHDGTEELLVMELGADGEGRRILLHDGPIDPDRFTEGAVVVLGVGAAGVEPWMELRLSVDAPGGCYLVRLDGGAHLLRYAPVNGGAAFELEFLSVDETGAPAVSLQETYDLTSGGAAAELLPLLEEGSAVLCWGAAPDGQERFAYLDELFTTFED